MLNPMENLQFKADVKFISKDSPCFKSKDYPPKDDFVMSIDENEVIVSLYGDDKWDFRPFGGKGEFQFGEYDNANKRLFKNIMYYLIYSHLCPSKYASLNAWYLTLRKIFRYCHINEIKANDLSRYPKAIEEIAKKIAKDSPSIFVTTVLHLNIFYKNNEQIGFTLLNKNSITLFKSFDPSYKMGQTPYIPVRIWTNFIQHLDSVLDDFECNQNKLEKLFHYLTSAYISNENKGIRDPGPFSQNSAKDKIKYNGTFEQYLKRNKLLKFFERHVERIKDSNTYDISQFSSLLNNTMLSCFMFVIYYSIMRKNEATSLRADCLITETDERLGDFFLLRGETTKTDPDSDDRWVVCNRVERAIAIAKTLLEWKLKYIKQHKETHYLFQKIDVWRKDERTSKARDYDSCQHLISRDNFSFFNLEQHRITQEDYEEALALTPSLIREDWFKVGNIWQFGFHQFRRTLAVHFALNRVSSSSTQLQMKHGTREQQFHYQNNAGRLRLNQSAEQEVVNEYYAEMARNISSVVYGEDSITHTKSPITQEVARFVEEGEMKKLLKAQKNGAVGYRKNLLGGCMKQGTCKYGGFDSITHCAGGNRKSMCSDLVIDSSREQEFKEDKAHYENQMNEAPEHSPRYESLKAETRGYEKVLEAIKDKRGGIE